MKTAVDVTDTAIDLYGLYMCGYDVQGRMLFKDSPNGGDYLWDGWRMVKKQAWPWGEFGETVEYVWGKDLSGTMEGAGGVGGLLAVRVDGAWHFPLYDHNGNIVAYVDSTGAVSAEYAYDPFGKVVSHTGMDFDFQFSTKFYDPDIGMYYYGYRYYSPGLRRWASRDPIGEEGGLNLYGFCGNDGIDAIDYLGEIKIHYSITKYKYVPFRNAFGAVVPSLFISCNCRCNKLQCDLSYYANYYIADNNDLIWNSIPKNYPNEIVPSNWGDQKYKAKRAFIERHDDKHLYWDKIFFDATVNTIKHHEDMTFNTVYSCEHDAVLLENVIQVRWKELQRKQKQHDELWEKLK